MNIVAKFPLGVTENTVHGLHQWDYGRQLEIHADDLPAMVEIHFACLGMKVAVVRTCSAVDGVVTATIPDICLEQTAPIVAWVYAINGTEGATIKTLTLPITQRARPELEPSIPRDNSDAYTDFVNQVNKAVGDLKDGSVTVERARVAERLEMGGEVSVGHAETATCLDDYASPGNERKIQIGLAGERLMPGQFRYLAAYEVDAAGENTGRIKDVYPPDVSVGHATEADHAETARMADGAQVVTGNKMAVSGGKVVNVNTQGLYSVTVRDTTQTQIRFVTVMLYIVPSQASQAIFIASVKITDSVTNPTTHAIGYDPSTRTISCDDADYTIASAYLIQAPNQ